MVLPIRRSIFLHVLLVSALAASAQVRNSFLARSHQSSAVSMVYRLYVPKSYTAGQKYPLLVALHGVGEKGSDNAIQVDREDLGSTWIADSVQGRWPHFVMVPQCPSQLSWGGAAITGIHQIIDSLKREFSLDTNRFYAVGLSMGARGTFNLLASRPGYFAAAVPCAGAGTNSQAADIAKTPLWAFHGSTDPTVDVSGTRTMVAAIENTGIRFVRFVSESWTAVPGLNTYSTAIRNGTDPVAMVARNPSGISYDSLRRAVAGGARYLYSEVTNGDHRTGWMVAFHHPLVPGWIFSKAKGTGTVALAPPSGGSGARERRGAVLRFVPETGSILLETDPGRRGAGFGRPEVGSGLRSAGSGPRSVGSGRLFTVPGRQLPSPLLDGGSGLDGTQPIRRTGR